jgi:hypothetical protein
MKESELRIGNWLLYEGKPTQVESIDPLNEVPSYGLKCAIRVKEFFTETHYTYTGRWLNHFEPIILTNDWLGRLGFVKDRTGWNLPESQFSLTDNLFPCWLDRMLWPGGLPDFHQIELKHVHQLQNLFYWLSGGIELTIIPPSP